MKSLEKEISRVVDNDYKLEVIVPTQAELERIRRLHRELTEGERTKVKKAERHASELLELLTSGELDFERLSPEMQKALRSITK